jgi:hypothetical protein
VCGGVRAAGCANRFSIPQSGNVPCNEKTYKKKDYVLDSTFIDHGSLKTMLVHMMSMSVLLFFAGIVIVLMFVAISFMGMLMIVYLSIMLMGVFVMLFGMTVLVFVGNIIHF